jgi:hypothetical protein
VDLLVGRLGNGGANTASAQIGADVSTGVGLVRAHAPGSGARPTAATAADPNGAQQKLEGHRVMTLTGGDDPRDRPAPIISGQVNLGG